MTERDGPAERTVREERSLSPMRRTIADRLQESYREAVHVTVSRDVDAGPLLAAAETAGAAEGDDGVDPSVTDVLLYALSDALADHPAFNATFEDGTHRVYEEHNVGVAVDIEEGLVTPVIADVGAKSLAEIAAERQRLTRTVQDGDYTMSTFRGGTFTVSNLGTLGVDSFTPVTSPEVSEETLIDRTSEDTTESASVSGGSPGRRGDSSVSRGDCAGGAGSGRPDGCHREPVRQRCGGCLLREPRHRRSRGRPGCLCAASRTGNR